MTRLPVPQNSQLLMDLHPMRTVGKLLQGWGQMGKEVVTPGGKAEDTVGVVQRFVEARKAGETPLAAQQKED
jgi:hypothetical protein